MWCLLCCVIRDHGRIWDKNKETWAAYSSFVIRVRTIAYAPMRCGSDFLCVMFFQMMIGLSIVLLWSCVSLVLITPANTTDQRTGASDIQYVSCAWLWIVDIFEIVSIIVYARLNWRRNGIAMAAWEWRPRRYADLAWAPRICLSSSLHTQDLDLKIYGRSLGVMTHDPSSNSRYDLEAITASFSRSAIVLVHDQKGYYYHYEFIHTIGWLWRNPHFFSFYCSGFDASD